IVPRASHPAVASDACLGRVLTAERKVISWNSRITVEIATSCHTGIRSEKLQCGYTVSGLLVKRSIALRRIEVGSAVRAASVSGFRHTDGDAALAAPAV